MLIPGVTGSPRFGLSFFALMRDTGRVGSVLHFRRSFFPLHLRPVPPGRFRVWAWRLLRFVVSLEWPGQPPRAGEARAIGDFLAVKAYAG
jgi:hypothetical protein